MDKISEMLLYEFSKMVYARDCAFTGNHMSTLHLGASFSIPEEWIEAVHDSRLRSILDFSLGEVVVFFEEDLPDLTLLQSKFDDLLNRTQSDGLPLCEHDFEPYFNAKNLGVVGQDELKLDKIIFQPSLEKYFKFSGPIRLEGFNGGFTIRSDRHDWTVPGRGFKWNNEYTRSAYFSNAILARAIKGNSGLNAYERSLLTKAHPLDHGQNQIDRPSGVVLDARLPK